MLKINWGAKIALLYGGFVVLIMALVIGSMKQDISLVSDDYYEQELAYQDVIDASKNQATLSEPVRIQTEEANVAIQFPKEMEAVAKNGSVYFYSPINKLWDYKTTFSNTENRIAVSRKELTNTRYVVKLTWEADGKKYYQESDVTLF